MFPGFKSSGKIPRIPETENFNVGDSRFNRFIIIFLLIFGFVRQQLPDAIDELSTVKSVAIGTTLGTSVVTIDDLMAYTSAVVEDLMLLTGIEDLGSGAGIISVYHPSIKSTIDGVNTWAGSNGTLTENTRTNTSNRFYVCMTNGLYHALFVETQDVEDYFHIRTLELDGFMSGKL